ncbi:glycosyltransferase [Terrarubrum flagellatum]|uniref:glycosyltransferase n=1 Tax=Terrirubrum flagellatum TaxID=2895980 RepID=UPI0031454334
MSETPAAPYRVDPALFTVVVTSCGRFDLLAKTIDSFERCFAAERIIIAEDSADRAGARAFAAKRPRVEMRINDPKLGQLRSIDRLYGTISTPYVIHLEDDWEFTSPIELERIVRMLESNPDVTAALLAHREYAAHYERSVRMMSSDGLEYKYFKPDAHPLWFSYSFNPSIARMDLWRAVGPFAKYETEEKLSGVMKQEGKKIALLWPPVGHHIGDDRHVPDPFQPLRPRNFAEKWVRSIRKRLAPRG